MFSICTHNNGTKSEFLRTLYNLLGMFFNDNQIDNVELYKSPIKVRVAK